MTNSATTRPALRSASARRAAAEADASQAHADALTHLLSLIGTDPKLAPLRQSPIAERITAERDELDADADDRRMVALSLGYNPDGE